MGSTDEQLLRAFAQGHDAAAVGELFDRLAPELLRVALHLARDPARAEDLVQSAFLTVLEQPNRWDGERRVLPWMLGILTNLARVARRTDRRPDPERMPDAATGDPAADAGSLEFTRALDDAIAGLPEPYRAVLVLHLKHGLEPAEIGRALERSAGTVRSQLARGLKKLRGVLPAGFAAAVLGVLGAPRGLAQVRIEVVAFAETAAAAATAIGIGSSTLLFRWVAAGLLLVAAAAGTGIALWPAPNPDQLSIPPTATGGLDRESGHLRSRARDPVVSASRSVGADAINAQTDLSVELRWLEEPDELPDFADFACRLQLRNGSPLDARSSPVSEDGQIRFAGLRPGEYLLRVDRCVPRSLEITPGANHLTVDLDPRQTLHGRVLDTLGTAVGGASIWLSASGLADDAMTHLRSDPDGSFRIVGAEPGLFVAAFAPGQRAGRIVEGDLQRELVLYTGELAARIRAVVRDENGSPVEGALLRVGRESPPSWLVSEPGGPRDFLGNPPPLELRSDSAGRFVSDSLPPGHTELFLRAAGYQPTRVALDLRIGANVAQEFVLNSGRTLTGVVRDRQGKALPGCVLSRREPSYDLPSWLADRTISDAEGNFRLDGLPDTELRLRASHPQHCDARAVLTAEVDSWDPELEALPVLRGRIEGEPAGLRVVARSADGREGRCATSPAGTFELPLPGRSPWKVHAIDPSSSLQPVLARAEIADPSRVLVLHPQRESTGSLYLQVSNGQGLTPEGAELLFLDRDGHIPLARFPIPSTGLLELHGIPAESHALRLVATGHEPVDLGDYAFAAGQVRDLGHHRLVPSGGIRLLLQGLAHPGLNSTVLLRDLEGKLLSERMLTGAVFEFSGLAPGDYKLVFPGNADRALQRLSVSVQRGALTECTMELAAGIPFTLQWPPYRDQRQLHLLWRDAEGTELHLENLLLAEGVHQVVQRLLPGSWSLEVYDAGGELLDKREVDVAGDRPLQHELLRD